ncbi:hypothetical protein ABBQ38_002307 [Trebouxia sp. C0009 RCD-2024]
MSELWHHDASMITQQQRSFVRHLGCKIISLYVLALFAPFIATGLFTHNQHTVATITSRQPSIANLRQVCNISFAYEAGGKKQSGSFLGERQICDSDLPDSLPIRYKPFSPQKYHELEGGYISFRTGKILSALAVVALSSLVHSCCALKKLERMQSGYQ